MFWLPKELIDYIWSFDDNILNKLSFNKCIKELEFLKSRRLSITWFSIQHYKHSTYMSCALSRYQNLKLNIVPEYSLISKYIIEWKKRFGNAVSIDTIKFYKPSLIMRNQKLKQ